MTKLPFDVFLQIGEEHLDVYDRLRLAAALHDTYPELVKWATCPQISPFISKCIGEGKVEIVQDIYQLSTRTRWSMFSPGHLHHAINREKFGCALIVSRVVPVKLSMGLGLRCIWVGPCYYIPDSPSGRHPYVTVECPRKRRKFLPWLELVKSLVPNTYVKTIKHLENVPVQAKNRSWWDTVVPWTAALKGRLEDDGLQKL